MDFLGTTILLQGLLRGRESDQAIARQIFENYCQRTSSTFPKWVLYM